MKVQLKIRPNMIVEIEEDKVTDLFAQIAMAYEIFSEKECGKCHSEDIYFRTRKDNEENVYYELVCRKCRAVLAFGCHKKGNTLFPKRRTEEEGEAKWLPDNGWCKWNKEKKCLE